MTPAAFARSLAGLATHYHQVRAMAKKTSTTRNNGKRAAGKEPSPRGTPSVLPRADFRFPGEVGRTVLDSDPPQFPQPVQAPEGAPNVLLILIDDCGFGRLS